ncbi:MAG: hypothetical protein MK212_05640 [Saprospiraceae bacterium]|nr:hypothetical protein [Saprospiraceae bacterium]
MQKLILLVSLFLFPLVISAQITTEQAKKIMQAENKVDLRAMNKKDIHHQQVDRPTLEQIIRNLEQQNSSIKAEISRLEQKQRRNENEEAMLVKCQNALPQNEAHLTKRRKQLSRLGQ